MAESRASRPNEYAPGPESSGPADCPFCEGNEGRTPSEVAAYRPAKLAANGRGWTVRTIPNKFPTLSKEAEAFEAAVGPLDESERRPGAGVHEVIVESPTHTPGLAGFSGAQSREVVRMMRDRLRALAADPATRSLVLFENFGPESGGTLFHPHAQLVALPVVPPTLLEERSGAAEFAKERKVPCAMEAVLVAERAAGVRMVREVPGWSAFVPFAAAHPYELRLQPTRHLPSLEDATDGELEALSELLPAALRALDAVVPGVSYNYVARSAGAGDPKRRSDHWHLDVIPRLVRPDGFEVGSGVPVNPVAPETAAAAYRQALTAPRARAGPKA